MYRSTRLACGVLLAFATVVPATASAPVELVRAGDAELSCQALAAEMNELSESRAKAAKRAESGRKLLGFATTALQVASSSGAFGKGGGLGGGLGSGLGGSLGGGQSGYIAQQALGSLQAQIQTQAMQQQMMSGGQGFGDFSSYDAAAQTGQPTDASVEAQRLTRLTDLHARKGC